MTYKTDKRTKMAMYRSPGYQTSLKAIGLSVQEKKINIEFQDGYHRNHLGFPIEIFLSIFDLQVTSILTMKFRVNMCLLVKEKISK